MTQSQFLDVLTFTLFASVGKKKIDKREKMSIERCQKTYLLENYHKLFNE